MLAKGLIGEKSGQGFYKRVKSAGGESEILTLDHETLEYRPRKAGEASRRSTQPTRSPTRASGSGLCSTARIRVGRFLRSTLAPALVYAAKVAPEIAYSPDDVDRVMRWGFGWELGPFETADAIGIDRVIEVAREVDPDLLADGTPAIWRAPRSKAAATRFATATYRPSATGPADSACGEGSFEGRQEESRARASWTSATASCAVEFHSKMNAIGGDTIQMLQAGVREAERNFAALVVGNEAAHFSAGANLMLVLLEAQEENWDELDLMVRSVPADDDGAAICGGSGDRRARRPHARRRLRDRPARRPRPNRR